MRTAGTITAHAVHRTSLATPPVRAGKAITTIQKYGRRIGTETITRNASNADWPVNRVRQARRASACQSARASTARPATPSTAAISAPRFARAAEAAACPSTATARGLPPRRRPPSVPLDSRGLQKPLHVHQPPQRECCHHADHDQYERERRPIRVFAAFERAPIGVEREDRGVIERTAGG